MTKVFGSNVFSKKVMKERLPKEIYQELLKTIDEGKPLTLEIANVVAEEMKNWAIEKGATHYTHWFQPLTGSTAEKHDSFIIPDGEGDSILEFSGKQLIKGEPDASSFPSGGLRSTFEARGYTAWDCTSPAFLKETDEGDTVLCIPTVFYSYTGEALDKKIPLLRSMDAISKQAVRLLNAIGNKDVKRVIPTVGPEQEYFLIEKEFYLKRLDLMLCGRTLFGAPPPKGQELEDHYFGPIKDRITKFMTDLDKELWKVGISAKTRHNEVAPAQFEMAPYFSYVNIGTDHNQLWMEIIQKVALRHGLVCLLHEKPFAGINGSGKHNNWSLITDDGVNLLDPGSTPHENLQFLLFLAALIKAIDKHQDILRASCATSGNDHRLGANEAPPAIISIFLGDELTELLDKISKGEKYQSKDKIFMKVGVDTLPPIPKDNTDRNRTSPFAFTGNKFEFRMVGSSMSIAGPNLVLNTIVAEALDELATRMEKATDIAKETTQIIKEVVKEHGRIIFNGNNYSEEWVKEAERRGLFNIKNTVDAHKCMITKKAEDLFEKYGVLSKQELHSRFEIYIEQYAKQIAIEAKTAIKMVKRQYLPATVKYIDLLSDTILKAKQNNVSTDSLSEILKNIIQCFDSANKKVNELEKELNNAYNISETLPKAEYFRDKVFTKIQDLRKDIDTLETLIPSDIWPTPTYADMLYKL
ncbi:MAG: glutamine synthetase III [Candidatus Goldbacteria bacterium]|nr:glutamine synthetase III [Candidatus Goldiibacteriota bacterium]